MADKTGYSQAVIVYKVRASDGAPLGLDGLPISDTGHKQAIALLTATANPNPAAYDVQLYFNKEDAIDGEPTVELSMNCYSWLDINIASVLLTAAAPTGSFIIHAAPDWQLYSYPANVATLDRTSGPAGSFIINVARLGVVDGQGDFVFKNSAGLTATIHISNIAAPVWILTSGQWNMLGVWTNTGLWLTT